MYRISDNAILGMEFLSRHDCSVACDKGLLVMGGKTIQCTDRAGRLLANKVQVTKTLTLPPDRGAHQLPTELGAWRSDRPY